VGVTPYYLYVTEEFFKRHPNSVQNFEKIGYTSNERVAAYGGEISIGRTIDPYESDVPGVYLGENPQLLLFKF